MLKTLKKIAFERVGGTPEEKRAFDILAAEIRDRGVEPSLEPFEVRTFRKGVGSITLTDGEEQAFNVNPVGLSGSAEIRGRLRFVEPANLSFAKNCAGKIVLLPCRVTFEVFERLSKLDVAAFLIVDSPGRKTGFPSLKPNYIDRFGVIPGGVVSYETGLKLISKGDAEAVLRTEQEEFTGTSHNLTATIDGDIEGEDILLCAHADSVADSPGAVDNAAGCVELLGILGHFAKNRPKRMLRFCFFGSEELGLLGSRHYIELHCDKLASLRLVVNFDLGGDIFGENKAIVTGPRKIETYLDSKNKSYGLGLLVKRDIYSSDNMPFAAAGIPAINFLRSGLAASLGHSADDDPRNIDERSLRSLAEIALGFIDEMANAEVFPFERTIPGDTATKIDEYFRERFGLSIGK